MFYNVCAATQKVMSLWKPLPVGRAAYLFSHRHNMGINMQVDVGKIRPNFFQCPNVLIDELLQTISGSELKCYLVIIRKTTGWHKLCDRISISQFIGITGLSNRAVIDACANLEKIGLIDIVRDDFGNKTFSLKGYSEPCEKSSQHEKTSQPPVKKVHTPCEKSSQVASEKTSHTKDTIPKDTIQKTLLKETISAAAQKPNKLGLKDLISLGVTEQIAKDWLEVRKMKRAPLTQTALDAIIKESAKARLTLNDAIKACVENSWQGFKADWYQNISKQSVGQRPKLPSQMTEAERKAAHDEMTREAKRMVFGDDDFIDGVASHV